MFRKSFPFTLPLTVLLVIAGFAVAGLSGCGSSAISATGANTPGTSPVSLSMTDDPPQGVSVLFFTVNLTAASLQPTSGSPVSLLSGNTPVQIDVTKLQALSAFLSTADVPTGTYSSLSLTFANPTLVIYNVSDTSLGSSCAVGSVCQLTPTIDNSATVTLNSAPFPVTVGSGSPLGFLVNFHLNTIIQSDLSVNLGATNGVTVGQLPTQQPHFGFLGGVVTGVNASANQFTLQTAWGNTLTVDTSSSTTFTNFPSSGCATPGLACVQTGDILLVQISGIEGKGVVDASQVGYVADANDITVEGTIVGATPAVGNTPASFTLLLQSVPSLNVKLPPGAKALVTVGSGAAFSVDAQGVTIPAGLSFASASDLTVGQEVQVTVDASSIVASAPTSNSFGGWGPPPAPSFTTTAIELEPSQVTGTVGTVSSTGFTLDSTPFFFGWWAFQPQVEATVDATTQTTFSGFTPDSLSGVAANDVVSVNGWLFATPAASTTSRAAWSSGNSSTPPTVVAQTVTLHSKGWF